MADFGMCKFPHIAAEHLPGANPQPQILLTNQFFLLTSKQFRASIEQLLGTRWALWQSVIEKTPDSDLEPVVRT